MGIETNDWRACSIIVSDLRRLHAYMVYDGLNILNCKMQRWGDACEDEVTR